MANVQSCLAQKPQTLVSLNSQASVFEALELMRDRKVRSVMIVDEGTLVGIVSERDCALKVLLPGLDVRATRLSQVMTDRPITVTGKDTVDHCMKEMTTRSIRHLPVVESGQVIGMISVGDIVKELIRQQEQHIRYLETYIKGHSTEY
jgi:hypothetical protein